MKIFNKIKGDNGETRAVKYLKKQKYRILACNYKCYVGEIDIIVQDKKEIVFVEVKTRSGVCFGRPSESVDERKQAKIRRVAESYILANKLSDFPCRFDVIEVLGNEINHIQSAF